MTEKRFKVAVYDDKAINGFVVLDLQKPNSSKRLGYENVYIGSKAGCEIVCNFGNSLADENEQLKFENNELKCALALMGVDYIIAEGKKINIPPYYEFEQRYDLIMHRREYDGYD